MTLEKPSYENNPNYSLYPKEDFAQARSFARKIATEFEGFVKCVAVFGSTAKLTKSKGSDIDVLVVVDDILIPIDSEVAEGYRILTEKYVREISDKLHITTLKLTAFWEYMRAGDPIVINILRDGVPIIDQGFFEPMQYLLKQGRIRPSKEAIWSYMARVPKTLHNADWHVMQGIIDLYWGVIDSAHAVLMSLGEVPPSPEHVANVLEEKLVKRKMLDVKYVKIVRELFKLQKMILHREITRISGSEYDNHREDAKSFTDEMKRLINDV